MKRQVLRSVFTPNSWQVLRFPPSPIFGECLEGVFSLLSLARAEECVHSYFWQVLRSVFTPIFGKCLQGVCSIPSLASASLPSLASAKECFHSHLSHGDRQECACPCQVLTDEHSATAATITVPDQPHVTASRRNSSFNEIESWQTMRKCPLIDVDKETARRLVPVVLRVRPNRPVSTKRNNHSCNHLKKCRTSTKNKQTSILTKTTTTARLLSKAAWFSIKSKPENCGQITNKYSHWQISTQMTE